MKDEMNGRAEAGKPVSKGFSNNVARDDGLAWSGSSHGDKKWSDSDYMLMVQPTRWGLK